MEDRYYKVKKYVIYVASLVVGGIFGFVIYDILKASEESHKLKIEIAQFKAKIPYKIKKSLTEGGTDTTGVIVKTNAIIVIFPNGKVDYIEQHDIPTPTWVDHSYTAHLVREIFK